MKTPRCKHQLPCVMGTYVLKPWHNIVLLPNRCGLSCICGYSCMKWGMAYPISLRLQMNPCCQTLSHTSMMRSVRRRLVAIVHADTPKRCLTRVPNEGLRYLQRAELIAPRPRPEFDVVTDVYVGIYNNSAHQSTSNHVWRLYVDLSSRA